MANSYICSYIHYIFSTKNRDNIITPDLQKRLWPYLGGIARDNNMKAQAIGGTENHIHILLSLPATQTFSISMSLIEKTIAYINNQKEHHKTLSFEEEYIAFLEKYGIEHDKKYVFG